MGKKQEIHKIKLIDKILIGWRKLKVYNKDWTPECKDTDFCCIVCGKIHINVIVMDSNNELLLKPKGDKTAKKIYTLDYCSGECANTFSNYRQIEFFDFNKITEHLDSGYWREKWINYYNWRHGLK